MSRGPHLTEEQHHIIWRAWENRAAVKDTATAAGCHFSTVYYYFHKFEQMVGSRFTSDPYHRLKPWQPLPFKPAHAYPDVAHKLRGAK